MDVAIEAEILAATLQGRALRAARAVTEQRALDICNPSVGIEEATMVEHVSAKITLGGDLPRSRVGALWRVVSEDQAGPEWGVPFSDVAELTAHLREGGVGVTFYGDEVASGEFRGIEAFCVEHGLSYLLTYDGCGGEWGPAPRRWQPGEREGVTCSLDADGGRACVTANHIRALDLQDIGEVLAHLQAFDDATSPALQLVDG